MGTLASPWREGEGTHAARTRATQASPPIIPATPAPTRRRRFPPRFIKTCWRMTRGVEDGQKASVFVALACHTWCFWTPKRPISIHCVIRQQSPESKGRRGAVNCAHLGRRCISQGAMNCAPTSFYLQHICFHDRRIGKAHSSSDLCVILIAICFTCFTCFTCIGRSGIRISSGIILKQEGKTLRYGETGPHTTPDSCASTQGSACCYLR